MAKREYESGTLGWWMDERRGELNLTWDEVADSASVSPETLRRATDSPTRMRTTTRKGIERALRWASGSIDSILKGGTPSPIDDADGEHEPRSKEMDDLYELAGVLRDYVTELEVRLNALSQSGENRQVG